MEKALADDTRLLRVARGLRKLIPGLGETAAQTLALGCLAKLWGHADTHIRNDDTLDAGVDDIDQIVGVEGFCDLMPVDWLEVLDPQHVRLPGWLAHNGVLAKKRAVDQKRQENHRARPVPDESILHERDGVATAVTVLRDKTATEPRLDLDQDQDLNPEEKKRATRAPGSKGSKAQKGARLAEDAALTDDWRAVAVRYRLDPERTFEKFKNYWLAKPGANARKLDWLRTWQNWCLEESERQSSRRRDPPMVPAPGPRPNAGALVRARPDVEPGAPRFPVKVDPTRSKS